MTRYRWQSRPGTGAQVTAGRAERQGRGSCSRLWSAWAAVSAGAGLHPHHGGGQRGAAASVGQGSNPITATVSAGQGSAQGGGPPPSWLRSARGGGPSLSRPRSARGGGLSPSAHGGGQCGARVHPHLLTVVVSAGRGSIPLTAVVSMGQGSIPICSRPGSVWAGVHPRPQPEGVRVGTLSHPCVLHQADTSFRVACV